MNPRRRIQEKLQKYLKELNVLESNINFDSNREASYQAIKNIISVLNKCYPLIGYINARFQEDFLLNLREFEHRYYIEVTAWPYYKTCISIIDKLINIIKTENQFGDLIPTQMYYAKNRKFSVLASLDSIFRNASAELTYYDPYMDHVLVEAISDLVARIDPRP